MKTTLLFSAAAGLFLATGLALPALADTVNLSGTVDSTLSLTTTATAGASALDLGGEGTAATDSIVKIADLAITTNNSTGYTLTVTSGNLVNPDAATPIAYQVTSVVDAAAAPAVGAFTVASGTNYTVATASAGQNDKDLYMRYSSVALQDPGVYTATVTVTVADN